MKINENRGDIVEIILDRVKEENKDVLYRLLEYSLFEESLNDGNEMNNDAIFEYKYFDLYFTDNERDAFFVKEKETNKLLGFVMINTYILNRVEDGEYGIAIAYGSILIVVMMAIILFFDWIVGDTRISRSKAKKMN